MVVVDHLVVVVDPEVEEEVATYTQAVQLLVIHQDAY